MIASQRLYILVALGMVPLLGCWWWPELRTVALVYDLVLALAVFLDYKLTQSAHFITATRHVNDRLSIGRANEVRLTVLNEGQNQIQCLVKDDYPQAIEANSSIFELTLPEHSKAELRYFLMPKERGLYQFGDIYIRYCSYMKLFWRQTIIKAPEPVKVFSDLKMLKELSIKLSCSSELGELRKRKRGRGTDFAYLKEYTVGDDSRSIDWKATARHDRPVLRIYEAEQEQKMLILIDAGRMMISDLEGLSRFEHALNAALALALTGLSRNDQVGFGIFANKPLLYIPPHRGKIHLKRLLEAVFDIKPAMVEPDYVGCLSYFASVQKSRSLMVVLTDLTDPTGSQTLLTGLANLSPRHLPFCVTLKDRQLDRQAEQKTSDLAGIYRQAVAVDLIAQRELALSVLVRRGCLVLDVPPQDLRDKLVDAYLDIKARGRL